MKNFRFVLILVFLFSFSGCYYVQKIPPKLFPEGVDHGEVEKPLVWFWGSQNTSQDAAPVTKQASGESIESPDEADSESDNEVESEPANVSTEEVEAAPAPKDAGAPSSGVHTPDTLKQELGESSENKTGSSLQSIPIFSIWGLVVIAVVALIVIALLQQKSIREKIDTLFERFK